MLPDSSVCNSTKKFPPRQRGSREAGLFLDLSQVLGLCHFGWDAVQRLPVNGFLKISTCCLLVGAGCQAPRQFSSWSRQDELKNAAVSEELSARIEKSSPGLQSRIAENQPAQSLDEHIRLGQTEVSEWYRDKSPERLRAARTHFEKALALAPQSSSAHHGIAIVADLEQNFAEAERHYQQALIQKPDDSNILGDIGYSYLLQNRLSESEQYSLRAVQANSTNTNAIKHLGDAYARQGKTELARETYAKVYRPEDIQKALAENAPGTAPAVAQANKNSSSIFDRLIPGKSPSEKLAADIQRRQQEYEANLQRMATADHPPSPSSLSGRVSAQGRERLAEESLLKQRLLEIDRQSMAQHPSGPILVDDQTGQLTRLPGAENASQEIARNLSSGNMAAMNLQAPNPAQSISSQSPYFPNGMPSDSNRTTGNIPGTASERYAGPGNASASMAMNPQLANSHSSFGNSSSQQQPYGQPQSSSGNFSFPSSSGYSQQPWTGIQQTAVEDSSHQPDRVNHAYQQSIGGNASSVVQANGPLNGPANPQTNFGNQLPTAMQGTFQQQQGPQNSRMPGTPGIQNGAFQGQSMSAGVPGLPAGIPRQSPMVQTQGIQNGMDSHAMAPNGMMSNSMGPAPGMNSSGVVSNSQLPANTPSDAYQQASQAAARMGMGVGPGGIFPVSNGSGSINPPGSMGYDSQQIPPPQRWMPDDVPPQNLNDAFQPYPNPVRPPASNQGQTPPVTYPSYSKEQFGTASRYDTRTLRDSGVPQDYNNSMQGYETQRWIAGREANMAVQQIWNQGPVNSPVSPSAGSLYTHPTAQGMMFTPNAPNPNGPGLIPEQWPYPPFASQGQNGPMSAAQPQGVTDANGMTDQASSNQYSQDQYSQNQYSQNQPLQNTGDPGNYGSQPGAAGMNGVSPNAGGSSQQVYNSGNQTVRRNPAQVIIPPAYHGSLRQYAPSSSGAEVTPAGGNDPSTWPTIIPASR